MEMPSSSGSYIPNKYADIDSPRGNREEYYNKYILNKSDLLFDGLTVIQEEKTNIRVFHFLDTKNTIYVAKCSIQIVNNFPVINSMWKYKPYKREPFSNILLNFILKQYDSIESSDYHTIQAESFWKKLLPFAFQNNYPIGFKDLSKNTVTKITNVDELSKWIEFSWPNSDVVPIIYAK